MIPDAATNAATRTVPIIPVVASVPAARPAPQPAALTLAPGRQTAPAPAPRAVAAPAPSPTPVPAAAAATSANGYFEWFQACRCGHSSAWHGGSFGAAWRSGHQVQGPCEASASEGVPQPCPCSHFGAAR